MIEMPIGWLSPTGEMLECGSYGYCTSAIDIMEKYEYPKFYSADETLIAHQWVQITRSSIFGHDYNIYYNLSKGLTIDQIHFLRPYLDDENCPIDPIIRDSILDRIEFM